MFFLFLIFLPFFLNLLGDQGPEISFSSLEYLIYGEDYSGPFFFGDQSTLPYDQYYLDSNHINNASFIFSTWIQSVSSSSVNSSRILHASKEKRRLVATSYVQNVTIRNILDESINKSSQTITPKIDSPNDYLNGQVFLMLSSSSQHYLACSLSDTEIILSYDNSTSDQMLAISHPILQYLNTSASSLKDLGWVWILCEFHYQAIDSSSDSTTILPDYVNLHVIFRGQYILFETWIEDENLKTDISDSIGLTIGANSDTLALCQCGLAEMRFINPASDISRTDWKSVMRFSGSEPVLLLNLSFNHGNLLNSSLIGVCYYAQDQSDHGCPIPLAFLEKNSVLEGEFILRTAGNNTLMINTKFTLYSDYMTSFWFRIKKRGVGSSTIFSFQTSYQDWSLLIISNSDSSIQLNILNSSNASLGVLTNSLQLNQWYFVFASYRPYYQNIDNFTEGILDIQLSTFEIDIQKAVYLPKPSNQTVSNQTIRFGSSNAAFGILIKQFKLYKGSFFNNIRKKRQDCRLLINYQPPEEGWIKIEKWDYPLAVHCILPESTYVYNEYTDSSTQDTVTSDFCSPSVSRLSLSSKEIHRCETCFNSSCPQPSGQCKDGLVQPYESCDDGIDSDLSKCSSYCEESKAWYSCVSFANMSMVCSGICGDGIWLSEYEECDDGNKVNGDGCSVECKVEPGYWCQGMVSSNLSNCSLCADFCDSCFDAKCNSCEYGVSFYNGLCWLDCPEEMMNVTNKQSNESFCQNCSISNCSKCFLDSNSTEKCSKCKGALLLLENTSCVEKCPDGYYREGLVCQKCPQNCISCSINVNNTLVCTQCLDESFFIWKGSCVAECEVGMFRNEDTCSSCGVNCSKCENENTCLSCNNDSYLSPNCTCALTCSLHQFVSNRQCIECHENCSTCSESSTKCLSCSQGYSFQNQTDISKCVKIECPKYCQSCNNSDLTCEECLPNYQLSDQKCHPQCRSGMFLNETEQECMKCSENCVVCDSSTICTQCKNAYSLFNNSCYKSCGLGFIFDETLQACIECDTIVGISSDCSEICGDGYRYSQNENVCDDKNLIDGDGCSSKCLVEPNYKCNRTNFIDPEPDYCYDITPLQAKMYIYEQNPQVVYLIFNRDLEIEQNFRLNDSFIVNITSIDPRYYPFQVSMTSKNTIYFEFQYKTGFQNSILNITFKNASTFHDKNNISFAQSYFNISSSLPKFIYIDPKTHDTIIEMTEKTQTASIVTVGFSAVPLALIQALSIFWCLIDAMQIANFYLLINIDYPENANMFFQILSASNLKFLPNYFEKMFNLNFTIQQINGVSMKVDSMIQAPARFDKLGMTSSFLKNAGGISGLCFLVFVFFVLLSMSVKIFEKRKSKGKIAEYVTKFYRLIRYDFIMRIQITVFLDFSLATLLQLRVCSAKEKTYLYGYIMSVICLCYLFYFFYIVLRIVNDAKVLSLDKEYMEVYGTLYEGLNVKEVIPRNYTPIMIIRKFVFCIILVYSHDYPIITVTLITFIQITSAVILVKYKPFVTVTQNVVAIFSEIFLSLVIVIILAINVINADNKSSLIDDDFIHMELRLGWVLISFCLTVLALYLLLFVYTQYVNYKKAKDILVGVKKSAQEKLRTLKSRIMSRTWSKSSRSSRNESKISRDISNSKHNGSLSSDRTDSALSRKRPESFENNDSPNTPTKKKFSRFKKQRLSEETDFRQEP